MTDIGDINELNNSDIEDGICTPDSDCEHSRFGYNLTYQESANDLFVDLDGIDGLLNSMGDNDWRLAAGEPDIAGGGKSTFNDDCGSLETPASCGAISMDLDGAWRTTPITPGAYERD
jgi:hypothetical protein